MSKMPKPAKPFIPMHQRPLFTVFGATEGEGYIMATTLQNSGQYRVRAVAHDPESQDAQKLLSAAKGCEIVKIDWRDTQSLRRAISGSNGVFAITNFWNNPQPGENTKLETSRSPTEKPLPMNASD